MLSSTYITKQPYIALNNHVIQAPTYCENIYFQKSNKNLAIANRSCIGCAHNTWKASGPTVSLLPWNQGHFWVIWHWIVTTGMALSCIVCKIQRLIGRKSQYFYTPLYLAPPHPQRITQTNFAKTFDTSKTRMIVLPCVEETMTTYSAVFVEYRNVMDGWTDRWTDRHLLYQYRVSVCRHAMKT